MTTPQWSQTQLDYARTIVKVGHDKGMTAHDIQTALMVALTESGMQNLANNSVPASLGITHDGLSGDQDSVGLFQQRPSQGWGTPQELMDPATSAAKFFDAMKRLPQHIRTTMSPWQVAQTIQRSKDSTGSNYQAHYDDANALADAIGATSDSKQTGGLATGSANWFVSLQHIGDFLSNGKNWQRIGLGALGAILILVAVWNILNKSEAFRSGVSTAKRAVEVAAVA